MWLQLSHNLGPTKSLALLEIQILMCKTGAMCLLVQALCPPVLTLQGISKGLNGQRPLTAI